MNVLRRLSIAFAFCLAGTGSCATHIDVKDIDHALHMCRLLSEPGVGSRSNGEVQFWYRSERAESSRRLWSAHGVSSLQARLATTTGRVDQQCLQQLLREAQNHQVE